jgi:hypothetical protein
MKGPGTKEPAEALLRELPSVVGAFVREDVNGHPREIHLLVLPGPEPRHLARDIRSLLEEKLGIPIDQRIISIAQLARDPTTEATRESEVVEEGAPPAVPSPSEPTRIRFVRCDSSVSGGRVLVTVELRDGDTAYTGEANELEAGSGRLRAGAAAALRAITSACSGRARFALDAASPVHAADRSYALITATVTSPFLGRRAVGLSAAQELDDEPETAAALAALKSVNRVLGLMREADADMAPAGRGRVRRR